MDINDILAQSGGLKSIASELGISEAQAATGAAALVPAIMGGLKKQAQAHPEGVTGLGGLLTQLGGGGLLDNVLSPAPTNVAQGNEVLGKIFGSKEVSSTVAQNAASQSGLSPDLLKKMLPMLAMLVAGYLATHHAATTGGSAQASSGGGLGGLLGGLLTAASVATPGGGVPDISHMLDMNGDGNPLDDILRLAGKAIHRS